MEKISTNVCKLRIGRLEIYVLNDGHFFIDPPQPILAPQIDELIFRQELQRLKLSYSPFKVPVITLLIKKRDKLILIDTGEGYDSEYAGRTIQRLQEIGVGLEEVTDVLLSHAHGDHIGGIFSKNGKLNFPNAHFYVGKEEWEFWNTNLLKGEQQRMIFNKLLGKIFFFEPGETLFSCITPLPAFGHTPGHHVFHIRSNQHELLFVADIFHSPILIGHPDWGCQWDVDFNAAVQTRFRYLKFCSDRNMLIVSAHLPWPGTGRIISTGHEFRWQPELYHLL